MKDTLHVFVMIINVFGIPYTTLVLLPIIQGCNTNNTLKIVLLILA